MSGFQIVVMVWLVFLTLGFLYVGRIVYLLAKLQLSRAERVEMARDLLHRRNDLKDNPFLKAGLAAIREDKKEGSQDG